MKSAFVLRFRSAGFFSAIVLCFIVGMGARTAPDSVSRREIVFTVRSWEGEYASEAASGRPQTEFTSDVWAIRADGSGLRQITRLGKGTSNGQWSSRSPAGFIYFQSDATGDYDLYRCKPDGSAVENLTRAPETEDYGFHLSPSGDRITYASHVKGTPGRVAIMRADGSGRRIVADRAYSYMGRFMPDGRSLVYVSLRPNYGVYRCDLDGGNERCLIREAGVDFHNPIPSPDGRYVLCYRRAGTVSDLWQVDAADGGGAKQLTSGNTHESLHMSPKDKHGGSDPPDWSPDGRRIVYATGEPSALWTMAADGADKRLLCRREAPCGYARWSPDGKWIAFVSWVADRPQLFVVSSEGGPPRQLTHLPGAVLWPDWKRTSH